MTNDITHSHSFPSAQIGFLSEASKLNVKITGSLQEFENRVYSRLSTEDMNAASAIPFNLLKGITYIASAILSRLATIVLLSPAAALDLVLHTTLLLPTLIYSVGKSIIHLKPDFTIPWQHLQRVRASVAPLLLGSAIGALTPLGGHYVSEPVDKYAAVGMLGSNCGSYADAPCSPVRSLEIIEDIAKKNRFATVIKEDGTKEKREIYTQEHIDNIRSARVYERKLESLQVQEWIHKITNVTLYVMATIVQTIDNSSSLSLVEKKIFTRLSGFLIPILTAVDMAVNLIAQGILLVTGVVQLISGRSPLYTEITNNPLMHVAFLIQNILKGVGSLIGTAIWFVNPDNGWKASLIPPIVFFKLQVYFQLIRIKLKMHFMRSESTFSLPILFGQGEVGALDFPAHSMHKTYLIVNKKKDGTFNLYWVNRPDIDFRSGMHKDQALQQIHHMIARRYPSLYFENGTPQYPITAKKPDFHSATKHTVLAEQGLATNCVVSNMFGTLEAIDRIRDNKEIAQLRYKVTRDALKKRYGYFKNDFYGLCDDLCLGKGIWNKAVSVVDKPI